MSTYKNARMPMLVVKKNKKTYWFILVLGIYCLLPFLVLSFYTYPQADDFDFAVRDSQNSFWETQVYSYLNWSGRFFGTCLTT
ncbi:hypothetical protein [Pontibacter rugosus]